MRFFSTTLILSTALLMVQNLAIAGTFEILPTDDGWGGDSPPGDGVFDSGNTSDNNRPVQFRSSGFNQGVLRSTFEFALPLLPAGESVTSTIFQFEGFVGFGVVGPETTLIHGYAGDGAITASDFLESNLVGTKSISVSSVGDSFLETLDVTSFIQGLYASNEPFAGLLFQLQDESGPDHGIDLIGSMWPGGGLPLDPTRFPRLFIETVPEPATLALLAFGGLMLARRRRKRQVQ